MLRKKRKKTELEKKQLKHVRNFAPTHYSWQQWGGKKLAKKQKKYYRKKRKKNKKFIKSVNKDYKLRTLVRNYEVIFRKTPTKKSNWAQVKFSQNFLSQINIVVQVNRQKKNPKEK